MALYPEWKLLLRKAWSIRFAVLTGLLAGVEVILPLFADQFPRGIFAALSIATSIAAIVSRVVLQKELHE